MGFSHEISGQAKPYRFLNLANKKQYGRRETADFWYLESTLYSRINYTFLFNSKFLFIHA
jgi:hypothetical protein